MWKKLRRVGIATPVAESCFFGTMQILPVGVISFVNGERRFSPDNMDIETLKKLIVQTLNDGGDARVGNGKHYLIDRVKAVHGIPNISFEMFFEAVWALIGQGLAYFESMNDVPTNWRMYLTEKGKRFANDEEFNPYHHDQYVIQLKSAIRDIPEIVIQYVSEAIASFQNDCFLSSAVMLGVASEAAFLEMAEAFVFFLQGKERDGFQNILRSHKMYSDKFIEFRKRVAPHRNELPDEIADNMELTFNSILDLLRIHRNESGHPTGKVISKEDAFINLSMFARYLQKMYILKTYFENNSKI